MYKFHIRSTKIAGSREGKRICHLLEVCRVGKGLSDIIPGPAIECHGLGKAASGGQHLTDVVCPVGLVEQQLCLDALGILRAFFHSWQL